MALTEPRNPINMGNRGVGTFASRAHTPMINLALLMVREKSVIVGWVLPEWTCSGTDKGRSTNTHRGNNTWCLGARHCVERITLGEQY
jgi:hypothetical protein